MGTKMSDFSENRNYQYAWRFKGILKIYQNHSDQHARFNY